MNMIKALTPATLAVALIFTAMPAAAQGRPREDRGRPAREAGPATSRDAGQRQAMPRQDARSVAPRQDARSVAPRQDNRSVAPRQDNRSVAPRQDNRSVAPRQDNRSVAPRQDNRSVAPRQDNRSVAPRQDNRSVAPRDYGRQQAMPRYNAPQQNYRYEPRRDEGRVYGAPRGYVAPRAHIAPRIIYRPDYRFIAPYRPHYFPRPYYVFRPRFSIGFGLWLGFGIPYPRAYVAYPPPVYGYYQGAVRVVPGATAYGGISFDIAPRDAQIFLDGTFIGYAGDFAPNAAPLTLTPGPHSIQVQADGYQPMSWDVDIVPGQVIPFRGDMQPY